MKNPLIKRLPREFAGEIAKYSHIYIYDSSYRTYKWFSYS